ncbi:MAG TPA: hydantoinase/oxoprolinase family protein [Patescibacteria group bacterium]|nr:hydantoinase/oxoprolinase family protein [Patescibacteria group bacterium]
MLRIGVDTGGTFTDFVVVRDGRVSAWKQPSTPDDPARAILDGILRAVRTPEDLAGAEVIHGSTVATNAMLEGKTARIAFVTNRGFEDLLEIGRQARPDLYNLDLDRPAPLAPRDLRFGLGGRLRADGTVVEPLSTGEIDRLAVELGRLGVEAVALCLLHSWADNTHEEQVARAFERAGLSVSVSSRIVPEYREYERASTTAVNAGVSPVVSRYLARLEEGLAGSRLRSLRVMGSNGGALSPASAGAEAVRTVLSGPAAGVRAAFHVGQSIGRSRLISFDMGGTSTDVCLVPGEVRTGGEAVVAGHPVKIPTTDIHTVGAGGGSIAWRDAGGALRVGPASAGADPGPACYGRGGPATVTDANLVLGRIVAERFLDGRMPLDLQASRRAVEAVAGQLGMGLVQTALGIVEVAEATMARAIRVISLHRGYEPQDFDLLAFGGAGGLHAAELATTLGIGRAIIPANPGVFSAFGMTVADVRKDRSVSLLADAGVTGRRVLEAAFAQLEAVCRRDLEAEAIEPHRMSFERSIDARYRGQSYEINVVFSQEWLDHFHAEHQRLYGYRRQDQTVQIVTLRLRGVGRVEEPGTSAGQLASEEGRAPTDACSGHRALIWKGEEVQAGLYDRARLPVMAPVAGPALILEPGATTLLPPGWRMHQDEAGHIHMMREGGG